MKYIISSLDSHEFVDILSTRLVHSLCGDLAPSSGGFNATRLWQIKNSIQANQFKLCYTFSFRPQQNGSWDNNYTQAHSTITM